MGQGMLGIRTLRFETWLQAIVRRTSRASRHECITSARHQAQMSFDLRAAVANDISATEETSSIFRNVLFVLVRQYHPNYPSHRMLCVLSSSTLSVALVESQIICDTESR